MVSKNLNRALILIIATIIVTLFVLINAQEFITAAFVYITMGGLLVLLILNWNKIKPLKWKRKEEVLKEGLEWRDPDKKDYQKAC